MSARCQELIIAEERRGRGIGEHDPVRFITVLYDKDGQRIAEHDSWAPVHDDMTGAWKPKPATALVIDGGKSPGGFAQRNIISPERIADRLTAGEQARERVEVLEFDVRMAETRVENLRAIRDQLLGFLKTRPAGLQRAWVHYQRKHPIALRAAPPRAHTMTVNAAPENLGGGGGGGGSMVRGSGGNR